MDNLTCDFFKLFIRKSCWCCSPSVNAIPAPYLYLLAGVVLVGTRPLWIRAARMTVLGVTLIGALGYHLQGLWVDPRLERLSETIRESTPPGGVVVHLQPVYYLSLRYHYLPDRTHLLPCPEPAYLNWDALPGYPAAAPPERLARMERALFVDPYRRLSGEVLGFASGRDLVEYACRRKREAAGK